MKINNLKINNYGKIKNKEIPLENNINIIYGKNEAGKSTILNFILNSFYGISKNKKGKEISDYEKYKPWSGEEFSGKIEYELDNGEKYEVYRDFTKKNPKILNEEKEDISKQFNIDKNKGNEFFYEQTKIDEELFLSTILVGQQETKLEKSSQNILIQKIANLVGTGEDNVSYKRAIDRLNRRQLNEIGTERSREKPINIIEQEIENLENEKQELEKYQNIKYEIEENKNNLNDEIKNLENENNFLKEIKLLNENIYPYVKNNIGKPFNCFTYEKDTLIDSNIIFSKLVKRLFDILIALIGCLFLLPIILIVKISYLLHKDFDSIFFRQKRIGKNGKEFNLYKFRSMNVNNNVRDFSYEDRITKIGKVLRKTSKPLSKKADAP